MEIGKINATLGLDLSPFKDGISEAKVDMKGLNETMGTSFNADKLVNYGDTLGGLHLQLRTLRNDYATLTTAGASVEDRTAALNGEISVQEQIVQRMTEKWQASIEANGEMSKATLRLKASLSSEQRTLVTLQSQLTELDAALAGTGAATEKAAAEQKGFAASARETKEGVEGIHASMLGLVGLMGAGMLSEWTDGAEKMAINLQKLQAESNDSQTELERLATVASGAGVSMDQLATLVGRIDMRMGSAATPTKGFMDALNQLGISAEEFSQAPIAEQGKMVQEAMDKSKLPTKQLDSALKGLGITAADLSGKGPADLKKIQTSLQETANTGMTLSRQLTEAGINFQQFANSDTETKIRMLGKYMEETKNKSQATALVMAVFGKQGAQMLPLIQNFSELDDYAKQLKMPVMDTGEIQLAAEKTKMLQTAMQMLIDSAMAKLLPVVDNVGKAFYSLFTNLNYPIKAVKDFEKDLGPLAFAITSVVIALTAMKVVETVTGTVKSFASASKSLLSVLSPLRLATIAETEAQEGANIAMEANPIGIVILAIAALAIGIYELVKHWDTVKAALSTGWKWISGEAVTIWHGITAFFKKWGVDLLAVFVPVIGIPLLIAKHWGQITAFASRIWNGVTAFFKKWGLDLLAVFVPVIGIPLLIAKHWSQITQFASHIWNGLVNLVTGIWTGFTSWVTGAAQKFVQGIVGAFSWMYDHNYFFKDLVDFVQKAWTTISNDAKTIWSGIKNLFSDVWNAIKSAAEAFWTREVNGLKDIWNGIANVAKTIWTGVTRIFSTVWNAIKSAAEAFWTREVNGWKNIWHAAVNAVKSIFTPIEKFFSNMWNGIKNGVSAAWSAIHSRLTGAATRAYNGLLSPFKKLGSFFSNLGKDALRWGENLLNMFAQGIRNRIAHVVNSVKNVAGRIASFLGFHSPAEEGPGSDADTWMPNLMNMLVQGIQQGTPAVQANLAKTFEMPSAKLTTLGASLQTTPNTLGSVQEATAAQPLQIVLMMDSHEIARATVDANDHALRRRQKVRMRAIGVNS